MSCSRDIIYTWFEKYPEYKQAFVDVQESILDLTENQLLNLIKGVPELDEKGKFVGWLTEPNTTAIIFKLKTIGKKRGYVERTETSVDLKGELINKTINLTIGSEDINLKK